MRMHALVDFGTLATIILTLVLFIAALFVKGLTHDLLLEAGVFLVSVKLVLMSYKSGVAADAIRSELTAIRSTLQADRAGSA
ncbi:MAG TPA: hypothetical protein VFJ20_07750 [Gemmatimonadaceae bacterium]|nr:hypothetical protein [Gemmatimonadaceae bacterium]